VYSCTALIITNSKFSDNEGTCINIESSSASFSTITIQSSSFTNNDGYRGAALQIDGVDANIQLIQVARRTCSWVLCPLCVLAHLPSLCLSVLYGAQVEFRENRAVTSGGAIIIIGDSSSSASSASARMELRSCVGIGNIALNGAGGLLSSLGYSQLTIEDGEYSGNEAHRIGGGVISLMASDRCTISSTNFTNNHARGNAQGGVIYVGDGSVLNVRDSRFTANEADFILSLGGGVLAVIGTASAASSTITNSSFEASR
jgi:predicted outer membrane repeat protein